MSNDDGKRINIAELFDDDHLYTGSGGASTAAAPVNIEVREGSDPGEAVALDVSSVQLRLGADDYGDVQVGLECVLENHLEGPLEIGTLVLAVRDETGALIDHQDVWLNTRFTRSQEVVVDVELSQAILDKIAVVDLHAQVEYEFQALIATATLSQLPLRGREVQRSAWPAEVEIHDQNRPGYPSFLVELSGVAGYKFDNPFTSFVVKLTETTPSSDLQRDLVLAFRSEDGRLVGKASTLLTTPYPGYPTAERVAFDDLRFNELEQARSLDVAAKGRVVRVVRLGSVAIKR